MPMRLLVMSFLIALLPFVSCDSEGPLAVRKFVKPDQRAPSDAGVAVPDAAITLRPPMPFLSCGRILEGSTCDPVTGWPCDTAAGETCDYSNSAGALRCYPGPNSVAFCGKCNTSDAFCGAGLLCNDEVGCDRFCCVDSDCKSGRCTLDVYGDPSVAAVGHCYDELMATCGGTAGPADAGAAPGASASAAGGASPSPTDASDAAP